MTPKAAQQKGDRFENHVLGELRQHVDANTHRTTGSGNGLNKNDIRIPSLDLEIEAKNCRKTTLWDDWQQTKNQKTSGNMAVLAYRNPRLAEFKETVIVMDFADFITLLQNQGGEREVSYTADPSMKYDIQRMVEAAKKVIRGFEK